MVAPRITIAVARHARRNEGSWAWIDVHGHGKARWMPTGDIDKLYCAAVDAARRNLDVNDPLVVTVAAGDETVARSSARTADGALHAHIVTGASDGLLDNALRLAHQALICNAGRRWLGPPLTGTALQVACDGSFDPVTRVGGWAWYVDDGTHACDAIVDATSSTEMEFCAALEAVVAVAAVADSSCVTVLTDCKVAADACGEGPRTPRLRSRLGQLAERLRHELGRVDGHVVWVPAHAGVAGNTQADRLARGVVRTTFPVSSASGAGRLSSPGGHHNRRTS